VARELKQTLGIAASLTPGKSGQFDVLVDSRLVYSKNQTGRFPNADEVARLIGTATLH